MKRFLRLSRAQFLPVILAPVVLGTSTSWLLYGIINPLYLLLALFGSGLLLLAANIINDVYDYLQGVDVISDRFFPPDFPGWKVLPRGVIAVSSAKALAYLCYLGGLGIGGILSFLTGLPTLLLALAGALLSYIYVGPPFKLAYRGLALGEVAIFISFGPIPVLGAHYIQTLSLDLLPLLVSIPVGILTTCVLINHDLIFYEPYREGGKRSLTVRLGRSKAMKLCSALSLFCYAYLALLVLGALLPLQALLALLALPLFFGLQRLYSKGQHQIPDYAKATMISFLHSVSYCLLLALGLFLA